MKKFFAALTLFLACALGANAQEQKLTSEENAKVEAYKLSQSLGLQGAQQDDFIALLVTKHRTTSDAKMSDARKTEMGRIVDERLRATLTSEQLKKLEGHPHLLTTPVKAVVIEKSPR